MPYDDTDLTPKLAEAARQVEICNACRYCEGYCAVFPAMFKERGMTGWCRWDWFVRRRACILLRQDPWRS